MAAYNYSEYSIDPNINPVTRGQDIYKGGQVQSYANMLPLFQSGFDTTQIKNQYSAPTTTSNQNTATGQPSASGGYLAVPHDTNPGAYNDIYNPQGQMINQQQFQQLGLNTTQIPQGSMQDVQKLQLGASGIPEGQQSQIEQAQKLWQMFNQQTPEQTAQKDALQSSLDKLIALQGQLAQSGASTGQMSALDKQIQEQQKALDSLNPQDYLNTQAGLKDVGITQEQLQRQIALQRDPIAKGLSDLLNSRSILGQQQQANQQNIQNQIISQQNIFQLQKALGDLTPSNKLPDSVFGSIFTNLFNSPQKKQELDTVFNLIQTYPDAKILPTDSIQVAQEKAAKSDSFAAKNTNIRSVVNPITGEINYYNAKGDYIGNAPKSPTGTTPSPTTPANETFSIDKLPTQIKAAYNEVAGVGFIDMSKIDSKQIPYAQRIAAQFNIPLLAKDDASAIQQGASSYNSAKSLINEIKTLTADVLKAGNNQVAMTAQNLYLKGIELAPTLSTNDKAKQFISARNSVLSMLTRAFGEKGVLTNQDIARIANALPGYGDNKELATQKAQNMQDVIQSILNGAINAYIGKTGTGSQNNDPLGIR